MPQDIPGWLEVEDRDFLELPKSSPVGQTAQPKGCCLAAAVASLTTALVQAIAETGLIASKPSMAAILAGLAEEVQESFSEAAQEWAGGAFSYLVAGIVAEATKNFNDQLWKAIGLHGSAILAIIDVLLNARHELILAAASWIAQQIYDNGGELIDLLEEFKTVVSRLYQIVQDLDFPREYATFVNMNVTDGLGAVKAIDAVAEELMKKPVLDEAGVERIRQQLEIAIDAVCKQPMSKESFKNFLNLPNIDVSELWQKVSGDFSQIWALLGEAVTLLKKIFTKATTIDYYVALLRQMNLDDPPKPFYSSLKKKGLELFIAGKRSLEQDMLETDEHEMLFKWPVWCGQLLALKGLYETIFPEHDERVELDQELQANWERLRQVQKDFESLPLLTAETLYAEWIPFRKWIGFAVIRGIPSREIGFFAGARNELELEIDRLIALTRRYVDYAYKLLNPRFTSPAFDALDMLFEAYGFDRARDLLRLGDLNQIKDMLDDLVANWGKATTTLGLGLTYAGMLASCLEPLTQKISDVEVLQKISQIKQMASRFLRALKHWIPIPSLTIQVPIDPAKFAKYQASLKKKLDLVKAIQDVINRLSGEIRSSLYSCE